MSTVQAEAESILTVFFKSSGLKFSPAVCSLLKPVIQLQLSRAEKFNIFQTVLDRSAQQSVICDV